MVRVPARPVAGAATAAVLDAVARAFGVRRRAVRLEAGASARTKVLHVEGPCDVLRARLGELLDG